MNRTNTSLPLKIEIDTKQIGSADQGCTGQHLMEVLGLIIIYDFTNTATMLFAFCLFYKIALSYLTKRVAEPLIK